MMNKNTNSDLTPMTKETTTYSKEPVTSKPEEQLKDYKGSGHEEASRGNSQALHSQASVFSPGQVSQQSTNQ